MPEPCSTYLNGVHVDSITLVKKWYSTMTITQDLDEPPCPLTGCQLACNDNGTPGEEIKSSSGPAAACLTVLFLVTVHGLHGFLLDLA